MGGGRVEMETIMYIIYYHAMRYAGGEYPGAETIAHITRRYAHIQSDSNSEIWHSKNILKDRIFKFLRLFCTCPTI